MDAESEASMHRWCVFAVNVDVTRWTGHEVAGPSALSGALQELGAPVRTDAARLAGCRADIDRELSAQLQKAQQLLGDGRRAEAQKLLIEIDRRFGGLAAPRSVELQMALNCNPSDAATHANCERAGTAAAGGDALRSGDPSPARR